MLYAACPLMTAEQLYYKLWLSWGQIICCPEATAGGRGGARDGCFRGNEELVLQLQNPLRQ